MRLSISTAEERRLQLDQQRIDPAIRIGRRLRTSMKRPRSGWSKLKKSEWKSSRTWPKRKNISNAWANRSAGLENQRTPARPRNHGNQGGTGQKRGAAPQPADPTAPVGRKPAGALSVNRGKPPTACRKHKPGRSRAVEHLAHGIGNRRIVYPQRILCVANRRADQPARGTSAHSDRSTPPRFKKSAPKSASSKTKSTPRNFRPTKCATSAPTLADRLREDYGIELAELEHDPNAEEQHQREEVQQEIDDLRRKLANLGNVNLEALEEIQQLEDAIQNPFRPVPRSIRSQNLAGADHREDQHRQPAPVYRDSGHDPRAFSTAFPRSVRRRTRRHRLGGRGGYSRQRHRDRRPAARQGTAEHLAS